MRKERRDSHDVDFRPSGHKACLHAWVGRRGEARCRPPLKGRSSTDRQARFFSATSSFVQIYAIDTVTCKIYRDQSLYNSILPWSSYVGELPLNASLCTQVLQIIWNELPTFVSVNSLIFLSRLQSSHQHPNFEGSKHLMICVSKRTPKSSD